MPGLNQSRLSTYSSSARGLDLDNVYKRYSGSRQESTQGLQAMVAWPFMRRVMMWSESG